jgi:hypothetical protein
VSGKRIAIAAGFMLAALSLSAANAHPGRLSPQQLHRIKTVAVISALGGSFLFEHVRANALEWLGPPDSHFLEISDWNFDPRIEAVTTKALSARFVVKPIFFQPADFSTWDDWLLKRNTLALNGDPAIDAYVLILRDWQGDEIGRSVHALGGLGLYRRDGAKTKFGVFASYRIVVVDALTGRTIASRRAMLPNGRLPWLPATSGLWPKTQNDMTEAQRATLVGDETRLIDETLLPALAQMNLTR